jgi:uncharacterized protein
MFESLRRLHFRVLQEKQGWLLAAAALLTLASVFGLMRFQIDVSSRPFFPSDDPSTVELESFQKIFPSQENILLAVEFPDTVFSREAVRHVKDLTDGLSMLPGVTSVWSLANVDTLAEHLVQSQNTQGLERYMIENPRYRAVLVSEDGRSALLLISTPATGGNPQQGRDLVRGIRRFLLEGRRADCVYHLSGLPVIQVDFSELILKDQRTFGLLAAVLLSLFMYRLFRTFWGVAVPMLCGGLSLCWTLGLFFATGHKINLVSSVLSLVILVISVANSIHLINYFLRRFSQGEDKRSALQGALSYALPPCLLATITTVLGFLSLIASRVPAVLDFALFASVGITLSFLLTGSLVPVLLLRWVTPASARRVPLDSGLVARALRVALRLAKNHRIKVLFVSAGCFAFFLFGTARIHTTMDVMASFPEDSPSREATVFLQEKFIGAHVIELLVTAETGDLLTLENILRLESLDRFLNQQPEVNRSLSALLFAQPYLKNYAEAPEELRRLMNLNRSFRSSLAMMQASQRELLQVFLDPDLRTFRLSLFLNTADSNAVNRLAGRIRDQGGDILGPGLRLRVTGELLLFSDISTHLVDHLLLSLAQAFGLIFLAIGLMLRSVKMLWISVVPNLLPIAAFFGVMGWVGIPLTVPTSMLACIVLGLSVDDTVHFLHNYREQRKRGKGPREAAGSSLTTVGRAMVFTSLILMVGFWLGLFSRFDLIAQFGFLAGVAILVALLSDLILLPVCLLLTEKEATP